jgi:hypothetical protein
LEGSKREGGSRTFHSVIAVNADNLGFRVEKLGAQSVGLRGLLWA